MSDLIDDPRPGENTPEFSVSELSGAIKRVIEGEFGRVRVRGEVGRVTLARSGHLYFDIKDERSVLASVSWKGQVSRLSVMPEEGMEVIATGRLTTFGAQSRYQLNVEDIAPAGVGALMAMLEKRRRALAAEGLFDEARKRPLPYLPEVVGVVTSPTGAVIRDILHRLRDRFPRRVIVWPVVVQGERSAPEVAAAIRGFNALTPGGPVPRPDVLIVARGGGSIEDLWGFNDEAVVRAAAESAIPLISAVGHETDTTLIDHAADRRAPTPTAAAEMAVPVRADLATHLAGLEERRRRALALALRQRDQRLRDLARALPRPDQLLGERRQRLDGAAERLPRALDSFARGKRLDLARGAGRLGPQLLLSRLTLDARKLDAAAHRLPQALSRRTQVARGQVLAARLNKHALQRQAMQERQRLARVDEALHRAASRRNRDLGDRVQALGRMLTTLSYTETLRRGFAVVRNGVDGPLLRGAAAASGAEMLEIEFADGRLLARPDGGTPTASRATAEPDVKSGAKAGAKSASNPKSKPADGGPDQGSLF
ncbi:exodeoxyribonuclease VII large subunit [Oceanibium sediminis]|uniref:exodeoxyribonuclease VII large subunit n=1 Tax=Oceanibium sediminis TaxID=2026339 RepID=UPI000DD31EDA|nr:exodeoxyribonuclease VII large subunit [Oceanibium sediminis]